MLLVFRTAIGALAGDRMEYMPRREDGGKIATRFPNRKGGTQNEGNLTLP
jgi:hypothetical protein